MIKATSQIEIALDFIHPGGLLADNLHRRMILAGTNKAVAEWNAKIQDLNKNPLTIYEAKNEFDECDDPHGHITRMLTPAMLKRYDNVL